MATEDALSNVLSFIPGASFLGPLSGMLGNAFGGAAAMGHLNDGMDSIQNLPGMQSQGIGGNFGQVTADGQFNMSAPFQAAQGTMAGMAPALMSGGMFNDPRFQQAFQANDMFGALNQANQAFGTQQGSTAFGQMGNLSGMLANQTLGGPIDFTGGAQSALISQGLQNQMAASNQQQMFNDSLDLQRQAAAPLFQRQQTGLQDQLFSKGLLGQNSTATGEAFRGMFEAQNQADLGFQNNAFGQMMQQQNFLGNLGSQQLGQGAGFLGQNLGQFNQGIGNMMGLEQMGFGQQLQANQFNTSQGQNRLNAAQGLFGLGNEVFSDQFGAGLGAAQGLLGFGQFGLSAARSPHELQAQLLQGSGEHSASIANMAQAQAEASGGLFGGIGSGLKDLFSDVRLKSDVKRIGKLGDLGWYEWTWNDKAQELNIKQPTFGVLAQEVERVKPDAVSVDVKTGYLTVDYTKLVGV